MIIIGAVPITMLGLIWDKCESLINNVIAKAPNDLDIETIHNELLSGQSMLITVNEYDKVIGLATVETQTYGTGHKVLYVPIISGKRMAEWMGQMMSIINAIALDMKCVEIRGMSCRKGWIKALQEHEFYSIHEIIGCKVKKLEELA